jgi:hypothetical protein
MAPYHKADFLPVHQKSNPGAAVALEKTGFPFIKPINAVPAPRPAPGWRLFALQSIMRPVKLSLGGFLSTYAIFARILRIEVGPYGLF